VDEEVRKPRLRQASDLIQDNQLVIQPDRERLLSNFDTSADEWLSVLPRQT
jgi:hypothetical protein